MMDLHTHCLPGVDDGAKNVDESLMMLKDSFSQGIKVCVATPHIQIENSDSISVFLKKRQEAYQLLLSEMKKTDSSYPEILLGAEVYLDCDISVYEDIKKLCIGKTDYMLVEFSRDYINPQIHLLVEALLKKGIKPVIAHIDRYREWEALMKNMDRADVIYQINAENFLTFAGRKRVKRIISKGKPLIVASDMHNMKNRTSCMKKAYDKARKAFKYDYDNLFTKNAEWILK